jgi:RND family efflux transporter MFP subunit
MKRMLVLLFLGAAGCHHEPPSNADPVIQVKCAAPRSEPLDEVLELPGRIEPPPGGDLPVASQVAGRLVEVSVREGQHIATGDIVASVDDVASRDAVRQAEATLAQSHAAAANANATLERVRALVARGIAARQELDDAEARAETEKQAVASATAATHLAQRTLGRVQVRATFPGVVTRLWRGPGALVDGTAATPIVQVAASTSAEFVAAATQAELVRAETGQPARVRVDEASEDVPAQVRIRSSSLDPTTGLGTIRIALLSAPASLVMGAYGRATITTRHRDAVLAVPSEALRGAISDGAEVVVCKNGKAELRRIRVGYRDAKRVEVVEGLAANERVAVDHVLGLDTGTAIAEGN